MGETKSFGPWPMAALLATLAIAGCAKPGGLDGAPTPRLADAALAAGYPAMALSVADNILARDPRNVQALVARGDALVNSGRPEDAAIAYRKALAVQPADPAANGGLGRIEVKTDPHAAERLFRTALAGRPDDPVLLANLGVALDLQERHVEAQAEYRRALQIAPDVAATKANLGLSLALSGDRAGAQAVLAPLAADPASAQVVRDNLAVAQMQPVAQMAPAMIAPVPAPMQAAAPSAAAPSAAAPSATLPSAALPSAAMAPGAAYVQLAAAVSEAAAQAIWQRESRRAGALLADHPPQIAEATVNGRSYWRLRVPAESAIEARRLCAALEARGIHCWTSSGG